MSYFNAIIALERMVNDGTQNPEVTIGSEAGLSGDQNIQGTHSVAIGYKSGSNGVSSIAIGNDAGCKIADNTPITGNGANDNSICIGANSGKTNQSNSSIAIGRYAGENSQHADCIALGRNTGNSNQGTNSIAMGYAAGNINQHTNSIAIGYKAGNENQSPSSVAIGDNAGQTSQGSNNVAVGLSAGNSSQGSYSVAVGKYAGQINQGFSGVAIGDNAGQTSQGSNSVAVGKSAGNTSQGDYSVAVGKSAGNSSQGAYSVAVGLSAGNTSQGANSVAVGQNAGNSSQGAYSVAVGQSAGNSSQGAHSVAVGRFAGETSQGAYSVAIGNLAGQSSQAANSIILNATGSAVDSVSSGFFVAPIASTTTATNCIVYDSITHELCYNNTGKTFVIDHPLNNNKYLIHACLEGPEAGVYYRGRADITNDLNVIIELPKYASHIANNFTINITKIRTNGTAGTTFEIASHQTSLMGTHKAYETSEVTNNSFTVYGTNGSFYWTVFGERLKINVEVDKHGSKINNFGPYTYLEK